MKATLQIIQREVAAVFLSHSAYKKRHVCKSLIFFPVLFCYDSKRPTQRPQTLRPRTNATGPVPGIIRQPTLPEEKQRGFALGRGREPGTYGPPPAVVGGLAEADDVA